MCVNVEQFTPLAMQLLNNVPIRFNTVACASTTSMCVDAKVCWCWESLCEQLCEKKCYIRMYIYIYIYIYTVWPEILAGNLF